MNKLFNHPWYKSFAYFLVGSMVNMSIPTLLPSLIVVNPKVENAFNALLKDKGPKSSPSRALTLKEMKKKCGKTALNPYLSGTSKWDISYKGVDMMTGNYSTSVTDLDFQGGFGVPVSVQRTYSANSGDAGPFGVGWSLSADVRTTAGGLLKGPKAPVISVPITFKEIPVGEKDIRLSSPPAAGVTATDTSASPETIQKDVDGVLTTPPWDNNVSNATYQFVTFGGSVYQVQSSNVTTTSDGTVYHYATEGNYPSGQTPPGGGTAGPSNVLKVTSVVDRQGNTTTYNYSSTQATFVKADGTTKENELTSVQMPNGHALTFTWGTPSGYNRILSVSDNGGRTVTYGYDTSGDLISVTTPGGKTTNYGYNTTTVRAYDGTSDFYGDETSYPALSAPTAPLLTSITDPRGLQTQITYNEDYLDLNPYGAFTSGLVAVRLNYTNGNETDFYFEGNQMVTDLNFYQIDLDPTFSGVAEYPDGTSSTVDAQITFTSTEVAGGYQTAEVAWPPYGNGQVEYGFEPWTKWSMPFEGYTVTKTYDPFMQTCLTSQTTSARLGLGYWYNDQLTPAFDDYGQTVTNDIYNFQSNPLYESTKQYRSTDPAGADPESNYPNDTAVKYYAYWTQNKFYQQKAVIDGTLTYAGPSSPAWPQDSGLLNGSSQTLTADTTHGRVSYTDYYPTGSAQGSIGQTYQTYSSAYSTATTPFADGPGSGVSGNDWQDNITPASGTPHTSQSTYDSNGRCTEVDKLQTFNSGTADYVRTVTAYGANNSTWWGEPYSVTEDYDGYDGNARTTYTLTYDSSGHATQTQDAAGHQFTTTYANLDYQVGSIAETDRGDQPLVAYTYGTTNWTSGSGITDMGQVLTVTDNLSSVGDAFTYDHTTGDGSTGQPTLVQETWPSSIPGNGYSVAYTYTQAGDRSTATYTTSNGTNEWQYDNYMSFGPIKNGLATRLPQTIRQISSALPTPEEFHYLYDSGGSLVSATFAMTPESGFTPTGSNPWYDQTDIPSVRARVVYDSDGAGKPLNLNYYWDVWNSSGGNYGSSGISSYSYGYDPISNLKLGGAFNDFNPHSESYGYDSNLDYLLQANYNDGFTNPSDSWTYDAAGNRISDADVSGSYGPWVYDNLNRLNGSPLGPYQNDILGNRDSDPANNAYKWDPENRLSLFTTAAGANWSYLYRADGMRAQKMSGTSSTSYAYDGQMGIEDVDLSGGAVSAVTDYATGGRSVERIAKTTGGSTNVAYPIYDGHGNMVSTLSYSGSTFSLSNQRSYDAWGNIRNSDSSGDPKGRYCAAAGHKADDESGLVYMKARYYDPGSARFASEDKGHQGVNWFLYCDNEPLSRSDITGEDWLSDFLLMLKISICMAQYGTPYLPLSAEVLNQLNERLEQLMDVVEKDGEAREFGEKIAEKLTEDDEMETDSEDVKSIDELEEEMEADDILELEQAGVNVGGLVEADEESYEVGE